MNNAYFVCLLMDVDTLPDDIMDEVNSDPRNHSLFCDCRICRPYDSHPVCFTMQGDDLPDDAGEQADICAFGDESWAE